MQVKKKKNIVRVSQKVLQQNEIEDNKWKTKNDQ